MDINNSGFGINDALTLGSKLRIRLLISISWIHVPVLTGLHI